MSIKIDKGQKEHAVSLGSDQLIRTIIDDAPNMMGYLGDHFCISEAGRYGIHCNVVLCRFQCQGFGKRNYASLAGCVIRLPEVAGLADKRTDVDNAPVRLL